MFDLFSPVLTAALVLIVMSPKYPPWGSGLLYPVGLPTRLILNISLTICFDFRPAFAPGCDVSIGNTRVENHPTDCKISYLTRSMFRNRVILNYAFAEYKFLFK